MKFSIVISDFHHISNFFHLKSHKNLKEVKTHMFMTIDKTLRANSYGKCNYKLQISCNWNLLSENMNLGTRMSSYNLKLVGKLDLDEHWTAVAYRTATQ
jgi:hypothetical protein